MSSNHRRDSFSNVSLEEKQLDENPTSNNSDSARPETKDAKKKFVKRAVNVAKLLVLALVILWLAKTLSKNWNEISQYQWRPRYGWLVVSGLFYLLAYFPSASFWFLSLRWLGQRPNYFRSVQAFYYSQLGKYVPGKAMVAIIRSGMVSGPNVRPSIAVVGVFYETLTMMGTGAFIGAIIVFCFAREHWFYSLLALAVALASIVPLTPPIFARVLKVLRVGKNDPQVEESLGKLKFSYLFKGLCLMTILWVCFGLSLWASILGLGIEPGSLLVELPRFIAIVGLSTTLGFAVPISPGGLGIREGVLSALLVPYFAAILNDPSNADWNVAPEAVATIVSIVQRITSIIAEIAIVLVFFSVSFFTPKQTQAQS